MSDTHYTGHARCPQFPKSDAANEPTTHIPIQPLPTPASIKKPSEIFPALPTTMNYARAATNSNSQAGTTTTKVPQTDNQDSNTTSSTLTVPTSEIAKYITEALVIAENYIEKRLNEIQEQLAIFTTTSKLHIFKNHLQSIHASQHEPSFDANNYTRITNHIQTNSQLYTPLARIEPHITNNPPTLLTSDITTNEVSAAIYRTRNTAAGPDNIPNILFKHYPNNAVEFLAALYTASFRLGALPPRWKHAHILLFPKPGKDLTNVNNYRPISLTLTICKLLERILNRRLQLHIDDAELIPNTQAGFNPHINIVDQLLKILTHIELARAGQTAAIVALDLQRAFDTVWHDGLRYKLTDIRLPPQIIRWISDLLNNRTAQVKINHQLSEHLTINRGVPQELCYCPSYTIYFWVTFRYHDRLMFD
ncbi:hypothetical protein ANN_26044 [Periplaneta americana]|uniref:Reverse transcriptase domain-containing protein n=1 Tax=Periplaneta americana TaxID=6978 RepID=A0ABQ8S543_PERAM|nr:hypothetical protein ANN_26044 [Periplaneta americana]